MTVNVCRAFANVPTINAVSCVVGIQPWVVVMSAATLLRTIAIHLPKMPSMPFIATPILPVMETIMRQPTVKPKMVRSARQMAIVSTEIANVPIRPVIAPTKSAQRRLVKAAPLSTLLRGIVMAV